MVIHDRIGCDFGPMGRRADRPQLCPTAVTMWPTVLNDPPIGSLHDVNNQITDELMKMNPVLIEEETKGALRIAGGPDLGRWTIMIGLNYRNSLVP